MGTNFAVAPGEYLQEWIDGNGMSVGEFAVELGVTVAEIEDLLTGKEAIEREIACQLERVTSIPSDSWIRFELTGFFSFSMVVLRYRDMIALR